MASMAEPHSSIVRLPIRAPVVGAPPRYAERRGTHRREEDRLAHEEAALLARVLDILASGVDAEHRLAGVLDLLATTAGARRAAVLSGEPERRVAVTAETTDGLADPDGALELAAWLDANASRSRAERAASGPALVALVRGAAEPVGPLPVADDPGRTADARFASLEIPAAGRVTLGFEMVDEDGVIALAQRLPPTLARHAAVALALVTGQLAASAELDALRAHESERERFVSTVAHDLRSPLTGLRGYLDLILGERVEDPAVVGEFLERSRRIVESMSDLVGDLLDISKLDAGNFRLEIAPFSVAEVAGRAVAALTPIALERRVDLRTDLPPRMRAALGDRRHVERVLTNLLGNALKFGGEGGSVEVVGRFDGPVATVAVRDDGPGIEAAERTRIFERFYRSSGHAAITGTGLGLAIARDLARAMGGDLALASVPGSGSSFVLVLPGPTGPDPARIADSLERAVAGEEVRLEEAAVLRAIRASGHEPSAIAPNRLETGPTTDRGALRTAATVERSSERPRLRSIDGSLRLVDGPERS
jgi:signal transduction histidine kinase